MKSAICAIAALAVLALAGSALGDTAAILAVDDDGVQCPGAPFTTIQSAVDAASPGDTIEVCEGSYTTTTINKANLTVQGARWLRGEFPSGIYNSCRVRTFGKDPEQDAVINGQTGSGAQPAVSIVADDTTFRGFTVTGTENNTGIYMTGTTSGQLVERNVVSENTFGIYPNSSGATPTTIRNNCLAENTVPGAAAGNGMYSDQGLYNTLIDRNFFTAHTNAAMVLIGFAAPLSDLRIQRNRSQDDCSIVLLTVEESTVSNNKVTNSVCSGIVLAGSTEIAVQANTVTNCAFNGISIRDAGFGPSSGATVTNNTVTGCDENGIAVREGSHSNTVRKNKVQRNTLDGVLLEDGDSNRIERNQARDNGQDGIHADASSEGNFFRNNKALGNAVIDCHDQSTGSGTAGTANFWTNNIGTTDSPNGICSAPSGNEPDDDDVGAPADTETS